MISKVSMSHFIDELVKKSSLNLSLVHVGEFLKLLTVFFKTDSYSGFSFSFSYNKLKIK